MFNPRHRLNVIVWLCILLFVAGLVKLFWLRFEAGDLYPPYSSMRSDPLGVQVLFESLQEIQGPGAERNFRPWRQVAIGEGTTLLLCGLDPDKVFHDRSDALMDHVAAEGGRLVLTFVSDKDRRESSDRTSVNESSDPPDAEAPADGPSDNGPPDEAKPEMSGFRRSGLAVGRRTPGFEILEAGKGQPASDDLPGTLPWRSRLYFTLEDPAWEVVYTAADQPVVVQREWGRGRLIGVADSYLFSNEALRNHRATAFLAWTVGPGHHVIFDEFHHGLIKQPGIVALMRKYRLHGVMLSLLVLILLWVWRQTAVFVPQPDDDVDHPRTTSLGQDSAEGWVSLMQQHIGPKDLLGVCYRAWSESAAVDRVPKAQVEQVRQLIAAHASDRPRYHAVAVYRSICELLKQGKIS